MSDLASDCHPLFSHRLDLRLALFEQVFLNLRLDTQIDVEQIDSLPTRRVRDRSFNLRRDGGVINTAQLLKSVGKSASAA